MENLITTKTTKTTLVALGDLFPGPIIYNVVHFAYSQGGMLKFTIIAYFIVV